MVGSELVAQQVRSVSVGTFTWFNHAIRCDELAKLDASS